MAGKVQTAARPERQAGRPAGTQDIREQQMPKTVSYTHLDVYKRQRIHPGGPDGSGQKGSSPCIQKGK